MTKKRFYRKKTLPLRILYHKWLSGVYQLSVVKQKLIKQFEFRSEKIAGNNTNYKRFLILAHARSGSTLLVNGLRSHTNVLQFGELFRPKLVDFGYQDYSNLRYKFKKIRKYYPVDFLNNFIFKPYSKKIEAVGFKLFPEQIKNSNYIKVWRWIKKNQDLQIILLYRKNYLEAFASLILASQTGQFQKYSNIKNNDLQVFLSAEGCERYFLKRDRFLKKIDRVIKNHKVYELTYEELSSNPEKTLINIQKFIKLDKQPPILPNKKMQTKKMSEVILNYQELKAHFSNTQWSRFFDE